jgi:hypothetical protein
MYYRFFDVPNVIIPGAWSDLGHTSQLEGEKSIDAALRWRLQSMLSAALGAFDNSGI